MKRFLNELIPFLFVGIAIVAFAMGIVLLAYLFLFGAIIGFILFIASWIKARFFPPKSKMINQSKKSSGRVIDTDDWRKL